MEQQDYSWYYGKMAEDFHETEWIRQMYIVFNGLKGELKMDGNQWCATCGEWPEHNISGFGDTPQQAMNNWYIEYYNPKLSVEPNDKRSVATGLNSSNKS